MPYKTSDESHEMYYYDGGRLGRETGIKTPERIKKLIEDKQKRDQLKKQPPLPPE